MCYSKTYRYHTVQEFNKGVYDYIIATDESGGKRELDTEDEHDDHGDDAQLDDGSFVRSTSQHGSDSMCHRYSFPA